MHHSLSSAPAAIATPEPARARTSASDIARQLSFVFERWGDQRPERLAALLDALGGIDIDPRDLETVMRAWASVARLDQGAAAERDLLLQLCRHVGGPNMRDGVRDVLLWNVSGANDLKLAPREVISCLRAGLGGRAMPVAHFEALLRFIPRLLRHSLEGVRQLPRHLDDLDNDLGGADMPAALRKAFDAAMPGLLNVQESARAFELAARIARRYTSR